MNEQQRKLLLTTAAVVALMVLFPPYEILNFRQVIVGSGYGFLFDLPAYGGMSASVAIKTLSAQIAGALIICGLVFVAKADLKVK